MQESPRPPRVQDCTLENVASLENLWHAAHNARRGKSRKATVEAWWLRREEELWRLHGALLDGSWSPGAYRRFLIFEPKRREIAAAPFADRVVHHALCLRLAPLLERSFIARSFSCQKGKGTTAARECCRRLVNRHRWVLKCDVKKFFQSIDHEILLAKLGGKVRCPGVMALIARIIASHATGMELPPDSYEGDDLISPATRRRGLPIGNLTSQLWGNFMLDEIDHWVTENQGHGAYVRYTDDFLLFGDKRQRLWELREGLVRQLATLRLRLAEPKSRMLACAEGVPFCGFVFHPRERPRILGATKRPFERRTRRLRAAGDFPALTSSTFAWYQFSREGNTHGLRIAYGSMKMGVFKCGGKPLARQKHRRVHSSSSRSADTSLRSSGNRPESPAKPFRDPRCHNRGRGCSESR